MIVPGEGPSRAKIVFVGEAPGKDEELKGRPFVGASGRLLDACLARAGINRRVCYITNVVKQRPPRNDFSSFYRDKSRREPSTFLLKSIEALREEIQSRSPNVVCCLGAEALRALVGRPLSIEKWRGSIIEQENFKVIPTYHPAFVLRMYNKRAILELDLKRVLEESETKTLDLPEREFILEPSIDQVLSFLSERNGRISFDIETSGDRVRCLALASSPTRVLSIPFMRTQYSLSTKGRTLLKTEASGSYWTESEEEQILVALDQMFRDKEVEKIAQNFPFDASFLAREFGFEIENLYMDTMVVQHCCYSQLPKSLDFLCSIYTKVPRYSDYDVQSDLSTWRYNCYDACVTFEVSERLREEAEELGVWDFYKSLAEPAMIALARAGNRGILIDLDLREKLAKETERKAKECLEKLERVTKRKINPNSPKQMKDFLYKDLGLPPQRKRSTGSTTVDEEALLKLRSKYLQYSEIFDLCLEYRRNIKLLSTVLRAKLDSRMRMRTSYNATGTVSGRISSSKTPRGLGGNLQNIPRGEIRRIFIASPGSLLIKADLSQAEARAVAWLSKNETLIKNFLDPKFDIHKWNASQIFDTSSITKEQRQIAKTCLHAANYGGGPRIAVKQAGVPYSLAKRALDRYKASNPELLRWWRYIEQEVTRTRRLDTPFGRIQIFLGRLDHETFKSAYSFLPQSLVADIINRAFFLLDRKLPKGCFPLLQVHDEIVVEALESRTKECVEIMKECLSPEIKIEGVEIPLKIPIEFSIGKNWYDMEELK